MAKLNEEQDKLSYVRRPQRNKGSCVSGITGRYEIPGMSDPGFLDQMRADIGSEPTGMDAPIPCKHISADVGAGGY